jgi:hypothetical protein
MDTTKIADTTISIDYGRYITPVFIPSKAFECEKYSVNVDLQNISSGLITNLVKDTLSLDHSGVTKAELTAYFAGTGKYKAVFDILLENGQRITIKSKNTITIVPKTDSGANIIEDARIVYDAFVLAQKKHFPELVAHNNSKIELDNARVMIYYSRVRGKPELKVNKEIFTTPNSEETYGTYITFAPDNYTRFSGTLIPITGTTENAYMLKYKLGLPGMREPKTITIDPAQLENTLKELFNNELKQIAAQIKPVTLSNNGDLKFDIYLTFSNMTASGPTTKKVILGNFGLGTGTPTDIAINDWEASEWNLEFKIPFTDIGTNGYDLKDGMFSQLNFYLGPTEKLNEISAKYPVDESHIDSSKSFTNNITDYDSAMQPYYVGFAFEANNISDLSELVLTKEFNNQKMTITFDSFSLPTTTFNNAAAMQEFFKTKLVKMHVTIE